MRHAFRRIVAEEGVRRGIYAGYGAVLTGTIPTHALMFAAYKESKRRAEAAVPDDDGWLPAIDLACGAGSELFALVPYVPAEVVAKRMQIAALGPARNYSGTRHALRVIYKTEGLRGLYSGAGSTMLRDVPFTAIQFSLFSAGKDAHRKLTGRQQLGHFEATCLGFAVGAIGAAATNPADVIKTRLQTSDHHTYRGIAHCFRKIVAEEGFAGLAKGVFPRMAWVASGSAITLAVFEAVSQALYPVMQPSFPRPDLRPPS
jgi:solute carrier family 25 (mitochondrial S-adenosylmethionine transporter), member 26